MTQPGPLGTFDVLFITLDTLRNDVAQEAWRAGVTPFFAGLLPPDGWERRHTPGSFTLAAHLAFFAGFLPTPAVPGRHQRLWACQFGGSETTGQDTLTFDAPDILSGFAAAGYRTVCIGGVGFFNPATPVGRVLPSYFQESFWSPEMGVTSVRSTEHQVNLALEIVASAARQPLLLFLNVSALHQPNCIFAPGAERDSKETMTAALAYVDTQLPPLFAGLRRRRPVLAVVCGDHGTAYGEDGYWGHRLAHPVVWDVPYWEGFLPKAGGGEA